MKTLKDIIAQSLMGLPYMLGWLIGAAATMIVEGIADGTRAVDDYNHEQLEKAWAKEVE